MSRTSTVLLAAAASLVVATPGSLLAQACEGGASFSSGMVQVGAGAEFGDGGNGYGAALAIGAARGPYGAISVGTLDYEDTDESTTLFGLSGGYQLAAAPVRNVQLCPIASFTYGSGPNDIEGSGMDISLRNYTAGLAMGMPIVSSPSLQIVPFGSVSYARTSLEVDFGGGFDETLSEDYGLVDLGAGFVMNSAFTFRPTITIPFAIDDSEPSFGLSFTVNFGARR